MRESLVRKARAAARLLYATRGMLPADNGGDHIAQGARLLQECAREIEKLQKALAVSTPSVEAQANKVLTYKNQPDIVGAWQLGEAARAAQPGGDPIDHGLSLLQQLQARGFGIAVLKESQR